MAVRARHMTGNEAIRFAETMRSVVAHTRDATEGMRAAVEKREPTWEGN